MYTAPIQTQKIRSQRKMGRFDVQSARVPLSRFRLASPYFSLGAELPRYGDNADHDAGCDEGVCSPVAGLGVPTTCW